jgi:hypothetical protein
MERNYGAKDMEQKIWSKRYGVSEKYRRDYGAKKWRIESENME